MRGKGLFLVLFSIPVLVASCAKEHTCTCYTKNNSGVDTVIVNEMFKSLKSDAEDACDAYKDLYYKVYGDDNISCSIGE